MTLVVVPFCAMLAPCSMLSRTPRAGPKERGAGSKIPLDNPSPIQGFELPNDDLPDHSFDCRERSTALPSHPNLSDISLPPRPSRDHGFQGVALQPTATSSVLHPAPHSACGDHRPSQRPLAEPPEDPNKDQAAIALGRKGGLKGGKPCDARQRSRTSWLSPAKSRPGSRR